MTTPEQKAQEIYDKMKGFRITNKHRKKCALVCVNEIIESLKITIGHCELRFVDRNEVQNDFDYWEDVLESLEKIKV